MDEIKKGVSRTLDVLEQDNRGVQLGCYSVALVGLSYAIRRVRPFSRFRKPSDIPDHFIKEKKELSGIVERIEPNRTLLMVRHKPLMTIPGWPGGQLPVKISGVNVTNLGLSWLQTIVTGNEVKFIPVAKGKDFVQCQVLLPQVFKNKPRVVNLGESLIKIGFGEVAEVDRPTSKDRIYLKYWNRLLAAENYALRKKLGVKYYLRPIQDVLYTLLVGFKGLFIDVYRHVVQIPKLPAS